MMEPNLNQEQLKELIKTALVEVLEQRRDLLHDAIEEALEDIALVKAMEEGATTEPVTREEVFALLEGQA